MELAQKTKGAIALQDWEPGLGPHFATPSCHMPSWQRAQQNLKLASGKKRTVVHQQQLINSCACLAPWGVKPRKVKLLGKLRGRMCNINLAVQHQSIHAFTVSRGSSSRAYTYSGLSHLQLWDVSVAYKRGFRGPFWGGKVFGGRDLRAVAPCAAAPSTAVPSLLAAPQ
eukprot:scaffold184373_cov17-Tisochrysis_lutea.AAC.1